MINLTNTQKEELKILNQRLLKLQEKILKEAIKIDEELLKRVEDKNDLFDDEPTAQPPNLNNFNF